MSLATVVPTLAEVSGLSQRMQTRDASPDASRIPNLPPVFLRNLVLRREEADRVALGLLPIHRVQL